MLRREQRKWGGVAAPDPDSGADPNDGPGTPGTDSGDGGTGSGGEEFSEERASVRSAVSASQQAVSANTPAARASARAAIASARSALDALVEAADAALEAAVGGSAEALGAASRAQAAVRFRASQALLLDAAEVGMAWSSRSAVVFEIPRMPEVGAVHRLRQAAGGTDAATLLTPSKIPPIMHEDGKVVMAPGRASSGDRLRMRGMPLSQGAKANANRQHQLAYAYGGTGVSGYFVSRSLGDIRNNRPDLVAGLRITRDGLVVDMGGSGAEGTDFRAGSFGQSITNPDNLAPYIPGNGGSLGSQANGYDLTLTFGRPSASPQGAAEHYWLAELMPTEAQAAAAGGDSGWLKGGGETLPLGVYDLRLSNHIGADKGREDPNGPPYPDDDENFYLIHAAYGFMDFYRSGVNVGTAHPERGVHRVFPFHVGYDAFKDEAGMRTTDIAAEDRITSGKFKGQTIAEEFTYANISTVVSAPFLSPTDTKRMRGDIELTATISGASNTITGKITNMEDWDAKGYWEPSTTITADIRFDTDGMIDAKGEFTGTFANYPAGFVNGGYRGNFYGPVGSLEAAGTWVMSPASGSTSSQQGRAIAGSFGAALVREDGSYGTKVTGGGS